jgi:peroxiredoxin
MLGHRRSVVFAAIAFAATVLTGMARAAHPVLGGAAPDCVLTALGEGPGYEIRQFRGKVLYVDFWASWCTTCVKSFPFLNDLEREFRDRGLQVLGINVDQKADDAKAFLARHPARFMLAADRSGACPRSFDVHAMPATYLIDRHGVVRYSHYGFRAEQAEQIRSQVNTLLAEPAPSQ